MPMANEKSYILAKEILNKTKYEVTNRIIVQLQSCQIITVEYIIATTRLNQRSVDNYVRVVSNNRCLDPE